LKKEHRIIIHSNTLSIENSRAKNPGRELEHSPKIQPFSPGFRTAVSHFLPFSEGPLIH